MAIEREYKLGASTRRCRTCDRVFGVGEEYYSAVVEPCLPAGRSPAEEERLERQDYCPACWKPGGGGGGGAYFSFWKARVPEAVPPSGRGPRLVDFERLMQLFEHLADAEDAEARRFRFVLALVLLRKRRLRQIESRRRGGEEEWILREVGSDRRHTVACPTLSDVEIGSVTERLREILDMPPAWQEGEVARTGGESAAGGSDEASAGDGA